MDPDIANGWLKENFPPWLHALSPKVERMACTGAVLQMPVDPAVTLPDGSITASALTGLAEAAMTLACAGHFRDWRPVQIVGLDLQFLQPAKGESLECTATVVRAGKSLIFTRAVIAVEPSGKEVAAATATFSPA